jgi:hypothetical protein
MNKEAIIKHCPKKNMDDRPADKQKWCLFDSEGEKLLGRHPSKEKAQAQERAVQFFKHRGEIMLDEILKEAKWINASWYGNTLLPVLREKFKRTLPHKETIVEWARTQDPKILEWARNTTPQELESAERLLKKMAVRRMMGNELNSDYLGGSIDVGAYNTGAERVVITLKTSSRGISRFGTKYPQEILNVESERERNAKMVAFNEELQGKVLDDLEKHLKELERKLALSLRKLNLREI